MTSPSPWLPVSPCGRGCLPRPGASPEAGLLLVLVRLVRAAAAMLVGIGVAVVLPLCTTAVRQRVLRGWFQGLLAAFGVRLVSHGVEHFAPRSGALVVSNHVSWLDVAALQVFSPMRLLAKTELREWPVVGPLAGRVGTLYIDRDRLRGLPEAVRSIADALREGAVVGAFPEGTTWCGQAAGRHRAAVYQAAVDACAPVYPVALRFRVNGQPTTAAAFVGDDNLLSSIWAVVRVRGLVVELFVLPKWDAGAVGDRRVLARSVERTIGSVTLETVAVPPIDLEHSPELAA